MEVRFLTNSPISSILERGIFVNFFFFFFGFSRTIFFHNFRERENNRIFNLITVISPEFSLTLLNIRQTVRYICY